MSSETRQPGAIRETLESINRYWFAYGSPTAMGISRITTGLLALADLLILSPDIWAFFGENGYSPAWLGARYLWPQVHVGFGTGLALPRVDILAGNTSPAFTLAVFALAILAALLTTLGLWSRLSSIVLAVCMVSIHHRNASILHGGDTVLRLSVLYVALAPSGASCSLDRLIGLWKGKLSSAPVRVSMWPQRMIAYNTALIYLTTTWLKWGGHLWQNGTATWYPARLAEFFRFPVPSFVNDVPFVYFTTYGTLAVEFALGTLVFFKPLRKYVLLSGLLMHAFIEYSMNIPLFAFLMVATYISFYDGEEISAWAERIGARMRKWHVNIRMPIGMQLKPQAVAFLDSADPLQVLHYLPGEGETWSAATHDERSLDARRAIATRSIGSWIFGWIPGLWSRLLANALEPMPAGTVTEPAKRKKEKTHR